MARRPLPQADGGFSAGACAGPVRGGDRSCRAPPFRTALAPCPVRFSLSFALSFFGPSLGTPFCSCVPQTLLWPLLTAPGLSAGGSPRVRVCSFRPRLWALQRVVSDSRASWSLAHSPPTPCLSAHLCSFGRTFACRPFTPAPCGDDLALTTVGVTSPRREPFIPIDQTPAGHTSAGLWPAGSGGILPPVAVAEAPRQLDARQKPRGNRILPAQ